MTQTLSSHIDRLKSTNAIKSSEDLIVKLAQIDKLSNSDIDKAYFLGHFFKHQFDSDYLLPEDKKNLVELIKNKKLEEYFYLKQHPKNDIPKPILYLFSILGVFAIIAGFFQLNNGSFSFGINSKYLLPTIKEGGYKIILGLLFFVTGLIQIQRDKKRKLLLISLSK